MGTGIVARLAHLANHPSDARHRLSLPLHFMEIGGAVVDESQFLARLRGTGVFRLCGLAGTP